MKLFPALVHKDDGSAYGVTFPDVPGCFAAADEAESLVENAADALSLWFEDQPMVEPRAVEAVRAAVADDLREGAFLMMVPLVERTGKLKRVNLSLDVGTVRMIDAAAKSMKLTRSAFVAMAAERMVGMGGA